MFNKLISYKSNPEQCLEHANAWWDSIPILFVQILNIKMETMTFKNLVQECNWFFKLLMT